MIPYSISINGGPRQPLNLADFLSFQREQNSLSSSWLKISTTERFNDAPRFNLTDQCELFLNNTRIFIGNFIDPRELAEWKTQGKQYLVECPWRRMRRTPYQQPFFAYVIDLIAPPSFQNSSWAIVWGDGSTAFMVQKACDFLIQDQTNFPDWPGMVPISKGIIDADMQLRPSKVVSTALSEIVLLSAQFLPDAVHWWNWSSEEAAFNWRQSANMEVVQLPFRGKSVKWDLQPSDELNLSFVHIVLQSQVANGSTNGKVFHSTMAPAGYAGPMLGGVCQDVQFTDPSDFTQCATFAQQLWSSCQNLGMKGSVTVQNDSINTDLRPGVVVNMTGGRAEFADMRAIVFKTVDDLKTGTTTATFAPKKPLTLQALQAKLRHMPPPVSPQEQQEQQTGQNKNSSYGMGDKRPANGNKGGSGGGDSENTTPTEYEVVKNVSGVPTPDYDTLLQVTD